MRENILQFPGAANPVVMSRVYNVDWICDYNMRAYPFDTQVSSTTSLYVFASLPLCINIFIHPSATRPA